MALPYYEKYLTRKLDLNMLSSVLQPRIETFNDIAAQTDFFEKMPEYDLTLYTNKKMKTDVEVAKQSLQYILPALENVTEWTNEKLFETLKALATEKGLKNGQILYPLRIALSGKETTSGGATEIAAILGKEETLLRVENALKKIG